MDLQQWPVYSWLTVLCIQHHKPARAELQGVRIPSTVSSKLLSNTGVFPQTSVCEGSRDLF